jgi:hypothetical protein
MRNPNLTFADILPAHLLPPPHLELFVMPEPIPASEILNLSEEFTAANTITAATHGTSATPLSNIPSTSNGLQAVTPHRATATATDRRARARIPPAGSLPNPNTRSQTMAAAASNLLDLLSSETDSPALEAARAATAPQRGA